jgi:hypothetical protein
MLKLDEEPPQALAVVRWGRAPVLEAPQGRAVVMWERALVWEVPQALAGGQWGRDLVMEAPGWPLPHGVMCTPAQGFLDLAGLDSSIESQPIGILGGPRKLQADNPLKGAPAGAPGFLGRDLLWYCGELKGNATSAPEPDFAEIG